VARRLAQLAALPVTQLRGVGPKYAEALERAFEIETVLDLLTHYPRRYIDRTNLQAIRDLRVGDEVMVMATVRRISGRRTRGARGRRPMALVTAEVADPSGGHLQVVFFNQGWRERQLPAGAECILFGKVTENRGRLQMANPLVDLVGTQTGKIVAVYPQSEKERLTSSDLSRWMTEVLERAGEFAEAVPEQVLDRLDLIDRTSAFRTVHLPETMGEATAARKRLVFDELLRVQLALELRKRALERASTGLVHRIGPGPAGEPDLVSAFHERLSFPLTGAQRRAIAEIDADLAGPHPMHRLLQGDVGAGKTVVAVSALLVAVQNGHQGALMAPTEVLAEQHHLGIKALLEGFTIGDGGTSLFGERPLRVELLTNRVTPTERRRILEQLAAGDVDLLIGTHALIQEAVEFRSLGAVVIDEQHRFGVEQRAALRDKSGGEHTPDVLVMTATPIPRTAAMTVYGDLDVSVLDELPPGRTPIDTIWIRTPGDAEADDPAVAAAEAPVWDHVRTEVAAGRQAYVVCPLVDESEKLEVRSATDTFERLSAGELTGLRVGLLHGRVPSADKEVVMDQFRRRDLDVLVATTVIEVGVDVPNATVMVILDADRFGIAQLHQLRGRVGRGSATSRCYLVGAATTREAEERLAAMVRTTDGFELAEIDLDLRGEGTLMAERQKGRNDLKLASLRRDRVWVERAREVAFELVDADPQLADHPLLREEVDLFLGEDEADFLLKS
jgi:ATP-dependent DNA helicase RecG